VTSDQGSTGPADETAPLPVGEQARQQNATPTPTNPTPTSPRPTSPPPSSPPPGYEPGGPKHAGSQSSGSDSEAAATGSEADRIRAEIEATRADLGETVDALSAKLDVKGRVDEKRAEVTETVKEKANEGVVAAKQTVAKVQDAATDDQGKPTLPAMGAAAGAGFLLVLLILLRRRRRKRRNRLD
jgi:LPXTG-motif cell wall-anchored protein